MKILAAFIQITGISLLILSILGHYGGYSFESITPREHFDLCHMGMILSGFIFSFGIILWYGSSLKKCRKNETDFVNRIIQLRNTNDNTMHYLKGAIDERAKAIKNEQEMEERLKTLHGTALNYHKEKNRRIEAEKKLNMVIKTGKSFAFQVDSKLDRLFSGNAVHTKNNLRSGIEFFKTEIDKL